MDQIKTPEWLTIGATVYEVGPRPGAIRSPRKVERMTATQVILDDGTRYRTKDLRRVGVAFYDSPEVAGPQDPRVARAQRTARVHKAMAPLRGIVQDLTLSARLYNDGQEQALENATRIRDAAQAAIDAITANHPTT